MKVLVATKEKQGVRKNDFSWTNEGELVMFGFECDGESVDGTCGCRRSFSGFETRKATTTAKIADVKYSVDEYLRLFAESMKNAGWKRPTMDAEACELLRIANDFPMGAVLEKRGNKVQLRGV
jgi:hypothetical protein